MLFSQRNGLIPENTIQYESLDETTRNRLWDLIYLYLHGRPNDSLSIKIWICFFEKSRDQIPDSFLGYCREFFLNTEWNRCFDFIEFLLNEDSETRSGFESLGVSLELIRLSGCSFLSEDCLNAILKEKCCAYRIVGGIFSEITSETEMAEVAAALDKKHPVSEHLGKALGFLTDRTNPDYMNSAKESITAVESLCCTVTGKSNVTLGDALDTCRKTTELHPALLDAFKKLYGFTCTAGGIRHGSTELAKVDQPLAQFIFVTSSAFINYVKVTQNLDL